MCAQAFAKNYGDVPNSSSSSCTIGGKGKKLRSVSKREEGRQLAVAVSNYI